MQTVHQYSVVYVRRVWGPGGLPVFLIFGASRPLRNLMAVILTTPVCCTRDGRGDYWPWHVSYPFILLVFIWQEITAMRAPNIFTQNWVSIAGSVWWLQARRQGLYAPRCISPTFSVVAISMLALSSPKCFTGSMSATLAQPLPIAPVSMCCYHPRKSTSRCSTG